jgi:prepilin-type N-terminal cleavage/methylation domain-containing protein
MKKRQSGFSMLEVLVAAAIMTVIMGATLKGLTDALRTTQAVTLMADTQENLRGAMNYMVRDVEQSGEGIPQGGITIPNNGATSAIARPGAIPGNFPAAWTALPAISAGFAIGVPSLTPNPANAAIPLVGPNTDVINVLYADNTLIDTSGNWLNRYPIHIAPGASGPGCLPANPNPAPAGSITTAGGTTTIVFDPTCINIEPGNSGLNPGDLLLLQTNTGCLDSSIVASSACDSTASGTSMALMSVSTVSAATNTITLICGDAYNLNCSGQPNDTIAQLQTPLGSGTYAGNTITVTRVWMVSYYVSNANPIRPQLMRQVNFNPAWSVGDVIENLQIFYDILNPGASPPALATPPANEAPTYAQLPYIRSAYILVCARSENSYGPDNRYFRNNLQAAVSIRGLDFYNEFQ